MMKQFGLIGYPLSHSFSPGYFAKKFEQLVITDASYDLYPLESIEEFKTIEGVLGLNVTIPYKEQVIDYLDGLSHEAESIKAVNTIRYVDGKKIGYNTDAYGFEHALTPLWADAKCPTDALVLGTGGAAKAVWYVLEKLGISYQKVSRTIGDLLYKDLDKEVVQAHTLIVNTTPLGMSPNIDSCPDLPYDAISSNHILFDLVYNPEKTLFLQRGEAQGAVIKNGLHMLELQADRSWEIWNS